MPERGTRSALWPPVNTKNSPKNWAAFVILFFTLVAAPFLHATSTDLDPLNIPPVGSNELRVISPTLLELVLINTKLPDPARVTCWDFIDSSNQLHLPSTQEFTVLAGNQQIQVQSVGFKRRVLSAPLTAYPLTVADRDLRIQNSLFLTLASPITVNQIVQVTNPSGNLWSSGTIFSDVADPLRWNPAIHVNQVGYIPGFSKKAMIGYDLGSAGELNTSFATSFSLVDVNTGGTVFQGTLKPRADVGFSCTPLPYQNVLEADFTSFNSTGEFWLVVPGMGASFPFMIHNGIAGLSARTYALGLYHQRCGTDNSMPFTRFVHDACHTAAAEVPNATSAAWGSITGCAADAFDSSRQTAPQITGLSSLLYPYNRQGTVDVSGGHHDAGDYSKYVPNSALLIHSLVFAADAFPNAGALDNLGIPESGDGKSDLLQEAKWEADFLAKMQDTDGGFYYLVYPRTRPYEWDVLPDHGDLQVVWPKTTLSTACAVGALAEIASSPRFKQQFPAEAAVYLQKAQLGWTFLQNAIAKYGKDGSYQALYAYDATFIHDDELIWAASAMFCATGDPACQQKLMQWLPNPNDGSARKWSWWYLFEGYGCAIRDYAFAVKTGRLQASQMDPTWLANAQAEVKAAGQATLNRANISAFGTSFSEESKRYMSAGWYFSLDQAFDLATAFQLDPNPAYVDAIISNMNYELGCNAVNVSFLTGLGWRRQHEIVSQYAQNDRRDLPPTGIPLGNLQTGFMFLDRYQTSTGQNELDALSFPTDNGSVNAYSLYDRWANTYNVTTEFVVVNQGRSLATTAFLMAQTTLKDQPWKFAAAQITGVPLQGAVQQSVTAGVQVAGMDLSQANVIWETKGLTKAALPFLGPTFTFFPLTNGTQWVEAEVQWPDGRRAFAVTNFLVGSTSSTTTTNTTTTTTTTTTSTNTSPLYISVRSYNPNASEVGPVSGSFTIMRPTGVLEDAAPLVVYYSLSGTAVNGVDYQSLPGSVVIPAGSNATTVDVTPIPNSLVGGSETVILTLLPNANYLFGSPIGDTVTIANAPTTSSTTTSTNTTTNTTSSTGTVTNTTSSTGTTTTNTTTSTSVTLPAITIHSYSPNASEPYTTTTSTSTSGSAGYTADLTVPNGTITDSGNQGNIGGLNTGYGPKAVIDRMFTDAYNHHWLSGPDLGSTGWLMYDFGAGNAKTIQKYTLACYDTARAPKSWTFQGSADGATWTVLDSRSNETGWIRAVVRPYTLLNSTAYRYYKLNITNNNGGNVVDIDQWEMMESLAVSGTGTSVVGPVSGSFTITRPSGTLETAAPLVVYYSLSGTAVNGVDYQSLPGSVVIPVGSSTATVNVTPIPNSLVGGSETVILTLLSNAAYQFGSPISDTVTIANAPAALPLVSMNVTDGAASFAGHTGTITVTRNGSTTTSLTVPYTLGGTAVNGTDYTSLPGSVTIPAGASSANITISPVVSATSTTAKTVVLTLAASSAFQAVSPTSATLNIAGNTITPTVTLPAVSVRSYNAIASLSNNKTGSFTIMRPSGTTTTATPLTVFFSLGGTAVNGTDYTKIPTSITIPAGSSAATVLIVPMTHTTKTVILTLTANAAYTMGTPTTDTVTITDNVLPYISTRSYNPTSSMKYSKIGNITIMRPSGYTETIAPLTVYYSLSGTAVNGTDYQFLSGVVTIPAGSNATTVDIVPLTHLTKTVVLTVIPSSVYQFGSPITATVTITDN